VNFIKKSKVRDYNPRSIHVVDLFPIVDADGLVRLYDLSQQAALTSPGLWDIFTRLGHKIRDNNVRVSFFSATPRGGGVALMRHALIRLWSKLLKTLDASLLLTCLLGLSGLNVKWYVPQGDSAVFDIVSNLLTVSQRTFVKIFSFLDETEIPREFTASLYLTRLTFPF
jgi:hypothetical protein